MIVRVSRFMIAPSSRFMIAPPPGSRSRRLPDRDCAALRFMTAQSFSSDTAGESAHVRVAQRQGQGIGRIGRRRLPQAEQHADHQLHLSLVGVATADDRLLDIARSVLEDRNHPPRTYRTAPPPWPGRA